jgi:hypothetical protein
MNTDEITLNRRRQRNRLGRIEKRFAKMPKNSSENDYLNMIAEVTGEFFETVKQRLSNIRSERKKVTRRVPPKKL